LCVADRRELARRVYPTRRASPLRVYLEKAMAKSSGQPRSTASLERKAAAYKARAESLSGDERRRAGRS